MNNASAINLSGTEALDMKRYDLMHGINARGTFLCTKYCIPHLKKVGRHAMRPDQRPSSHHAQSTNPHILTLSPPLDLKAKWLVICS